ncbi:MAG: tetraacyldisaccharide 4'-kinase [Burkholderiales bacterium]|nr:MAG: tetraacyldisaccharide 4'-kinase [Burkholderiales bacterium]
MGFSERLQKSWYSPKKDWLSLALLDVSWVYGGLVKLRRTLYANGVMNSMRISVPVIVVGNVIAGGAGKTPIVMALAKLLQDQGFKPGIVSRGYGRKGSGVLEVLCDTPVFESGDEPALIKSALSAPVFVANERSEAALALLAAYPQTNAILCDDGLQHLALQRDIEICVFDERGIGNGRLLPAGPLRESWPRNVDFVLHRGGFEVGFEIERKLADHALLADGTQITLTDLAQHELTALAGIANPESFFSMLLERGLRLKETIPLPDHYDFNSASRTFHAGQWLICTQKDAVKLWKTPFAQQCTIAAVPLQVNLPEAFTTDLLEKLSSLAIVK